jgi:type II secretory pathway pseudopilin PulG
MRGFFSRLIIAVLAAILFAVFAQAREKGRQVTCLSNQRQISQAILMYAQDNNGALPPPEKAIVVCNLPAKVTQCPSSKSVVYGINTSLKDRNINAANVMGLMVVADAKQPTFSSYNDLAPIHAKTAIAVNLRQEAIYVKNDPNYDFGFPAVLRENTEMTGRYGIEIIALGTASQANSNATVNCGKFGLVKRVKLDLPSGFSAKEPNDFAVADFLPAIFDEASLFPSGGLNPMTDGKRRVNRILLVTDLSCPPTGDHHNRFALPPLLEGGTRVVNIPERVKDAGGSSGSSGSGGTSSGGGGNATGTTSTGAVNLPPGVTPMGPPPSIYMGNWCPMLEGIDDALWVKQNDPSITWLKSERGTDTEHPFGYGPPRCQDANQDTSKGFISTYAKCRPDIDREQLWNALMLSPKSVQYRESSDAFLHKKVVFLQNHAKELCPQMDEFFWSNLLKKRASGGMSYGNETFEKIE